MHNNTVKWHSNEIIEFLPEITMVSFFLLRRRHVLVTQFSECDTKKKKCSPRNPNQNEIVLKLFFSYIIASLFC